MSTGKKKIKIELEDADGGKYNLSLEGNLSKDKIQKVLQLVESLNISKEETNIPLKQNIEPNNNFQRYSNGIDSHPNSTESKESKIWTLIQNNFAFSSFSSSDIVESYEILYGEQLALSMISTYLSRYVEKNKLIRSKRGKEWIYKLIKNQRSVISSRDMIDSRSTRLTDSHLPSEDQSDDVFLKQNALSTVYDLRL